MKTTTYHQLRQSTYKKYKLISKIHCPYFRKQIHFTSQGFWHLIYTGRNKPRDKKTQKLRLKLLNQAVKVIKTTNTLQEYQKIPYKNIYFYGFIAIIDGWKIKVIVKKRGKGKLVFWSVIPNWTTNNKRDRLLHKGNMEID
jgi:hypothetical protein